MRHMMHAALVNVLIFILKEVGVPKMAVLTKARGFRVSDAYRPRAVVVLDFFCRGPAHGGRCRSVRLSTYIT